MTDDEKCEKTGGPMCPGCPGLFGGCGIRLMREEEERRAQG